MDIINKSIVRIFFEVKKELDYYYIFNEKKKINDYILKKIYTIWGKYLRTSMFDYNSIALSFNRVYYLKNLLKNLIFFDRYFNLIENSILDVGCGAAPASIAIAKLMKNRNTENISISLIDKSKNQLLIAKDIAQIMSIEVESYKESVFEIQSEKYNELVIFSYFFCEQKRNFLRILFDNREKFSGGFVIIDYHENIMKIEKYFTNNGENRMESVSLKYSVPKRVSELIYDSEVNVYGCFFRP